MATQSSVIPAPAHEGWSLECVSTFPRLRALAWSDDILYASCGYALMRARMNASKVEWEQVASYRPAWWRNLSSSTRLGFRLFRDGFHALAIVSSGHLVAAVPGAIVTLPPGERQFHVSHQVKRGTRPLHITAIPNGQVFWGEYFGNPARDEVHIYTSTDQGATWSTVYTFPSDAIRHVHNIVFDPWGDCLWVLTGDNGAECRILRASYDFKTVETVLSGNQQARAVALVPAKDGLYFSSDTPLEVNHVYRLDRDGKLAKLASLNSSSMCGCRVGDALYFSTMVEPSAANPDRNVAIYGRDGEQWARMLAWKKDRWPMGLFQYGNAFFPDGQNTSGLLAVTTVAVEKADCETSIWRLKT